MTLTGLPVSAAKPERTRTAHAKRPLTKVICSSQTLDTTSTKKQALYCIHKTQNKTLQIEIHEIGCICIAFRSLSGHGARAGLSGCGGTPECGDSDRVRE